MTQQAPNTLWTIQDDGWQAAAARTGAGYCSCFLQFANKLSSHSVCLAE
jgi:hypothetical protein